MLHSLNLRIDSTINNCFNISYSNGILIIICDEDSKPNIKKFLNTINKIVQEMEPNYNKYDKCKSDLISLFEYFKRNLN